MGKDLKRALIGLGAGSLLYRSFYRGVNPQDLDNNNNFKNKNLIMEQKNEQDFIIINYDVILSEWKDLEQKIMDLKSGR